MPFKYVFSSIFLFGFGCGKNIEELPAKECTLGTQTEISYSFDEMLCVQFEMDEDDFIDMAAQVRFEGETSDQLQGVIGHIIQSCTEPFPDPFEYFPASVRIDGLQSSNVGVRKKGFVGSVLFGSDQRPSMKIKANKYESEQTIGGENRITFNNNLTDSTRMRTCLVYEVFRDAGYPAPLCNLANVMVNGYSRGAYTHVEPIKEPFLMRSFGNDNGSLYEITIVDFTEEHLADGLGRWEVKTDSTVEEVVLIDNIVQALHSTDEDLEEVLDAVLDVEQFLTFWALETLLAHGDGYNSNANNTYVYFDPDNTNRAVLIPWGADDAMQGSEDEESFVNSALSRRLSQHPELSLRYLERLEEILTSVWNEDLMLERLEVLQEHVQSAEDYPGYDSDVDELRMWVVNRREEMESLIMEGGVEGETPDDVCVLGMEMEELIVLGEVVGTVSYSCASISTKSHDLWFLMCFLLCGWRKINPRDSKSYGE
jgi:spore coat protein CotH